MCQKQIVVEENDPRFPLASTVKGYAESSTIHGLAYLVEEGRSIVER